MPSPRAPRAPRLRRALAAATLCVAALSLWWLKGLGRGPFWGLGWVNWVPHEAWGASWLGLALALATPHPRWRLWAAPWLALIVTWPWVEPRWLADAPLWQAAAAALGSAAALWTLWRCASPPANPRATDSATDSATDKTSDSDTPSPALQRMIQGAWACLHLDPDAAEGGHSRHCALLTSRGLRVYLWRGGACVCAPSDAVGGWPTANQRALAADAKPLGVTATWALSPPTLWLIGSLSAPPSPDHLSALISKALNGWATRAKPSASSSQDPPQSPIPLDATLPPPLPDAPFNPRLSIAAARAVAAAALGICGLGFAWQALIFPIWEGASVWLWSALGLAALIGAASFASRRLNTPTAPHQPAALAFAAAHTLRLALLDLAHGDTDDDDTDDAEDDDTSSNADSPRASRSDPARPAPLPRWRSLCPDQAPTPEAAWRQGLGVCVTDTFEGVTLTLSLWLCPDDPARVTESLSLHATDAASFGLSFLRAALLSAAIPHEGRHSADGESLHLQSTHPLRDLLQPHPWASLTRWWRARAQSDLAPNDDDAFAHARAQTLRPSLQSPWQHDAPPALRAHIHAWTFPQALRAARLRVAALTSACALIAASLLAMPRVDSAAFSPAPFSVAAGIADAAARCPAPQPDPSTPDTWTRLQALRCLASTTGQVGPLRRLDWEILSRPLQRLLEALAGWSALQAHDMSPSCLEAAARLRLVLDSPELHLSLAILTRHHPPSWRALHTPRPFFWPNAIAQHARAIQWPLLERWASQCQHTLSPTDLLHLRTLWSGVAR